MFLNRILPSFCLFITLLVSCKGEHLVSTPDLGLDVSVAENGPDVGSETDAETQIDWFDCEFQTNQRRSQCGYLQVPVDYSQPKGETLQVAFVIYRGRGDESESYPIVLSELEPLVERSESFLESFWGDWYHEHDLIFVDPRGVGLSQPQVTCPEFPQVWWDSLPDGGISSQQWQVLHERCRHNLETQHVNLDAYSVANIAADLKTLRIELEYPQWSILSEGALAYEHLRIDPEGIRGLILDNEIPIYSEQLTHYAAAEETMHQIFELCRQDIDCNETFPDLEETFFEVTERLDKEAITVKVDNVAGVGRTEYAVDGRRVVEIILSAMAYGDPGLIAHIPRIIYQLHDGKNTLLEDMMTYDLPFPDAYTGWRWLLKCRQTPAVDEASTNTALAAISPALTGYFERDAANERAICSAWGQPDEFPSAYVLGTTPILLFIGEWNWSTPRPLVDAFKKVSPGARVVTFPMTGYGTLFTRGPMTCSQDLLQAFVDDPLAPLDTQCVPKEREITWITLQ